MNYKGGELRVYFEAVIEKAMKENPELAEAMEIFNLSQQNYQTTLDAMTVMRPVVNLTSVQKTSQGEFNNVYVSTDAAYHRR